MTSVPPPPAPPSLDPPYYEPPPPPPPGPPVRGQLRRSRTDKVIGGVAGGLAQYSGIDPLLWRVGFVALTFAGGTGILVYLLLWLLMPTVPATPGDPTAAEPSAPAGPRSPVPGVTVAALLIVVGVLALIARFTDWNPGAVGFLGSALLVVGLGLVAVAFTGGRAAKGGLITLGVVLSVALLFASAVPWRDFDRGVGDRSYAPATAEGVRPVYDSGVGDVRLDLTAVDVSDLDAPIRTRIDHGIGDIDVRVPRDADVRVVVDSGMGRVDLFEDQVSDGGLFPGVGSGSWVDDGEAEIVLTIDNGIGDVEVTRG
jgi:phage shock protein PspC (stress-responsive transcriptional regulator)